MGRTSYVIEWYGHVCNIFNNLMQAYIESLIQFSSARTKLLMFLKWSQSICGWTLLLLTIMVHCGV